MGSQHLFGYLAIIPEQGLTRGEEGRALLELVQAGKIRVDIVNDQVGLRGDAARLPVLCRYRTAALPLTIPCIASPLNTGTLATICRLPASIASPNSAVA